MTVTVGEPVSVNQVSSERVDWFASRFDAVASNMETVIQGKRSVIELVLMCLVAEGHVLIEDVPGVGKTSLAKALARTVGGSFGRIQFTPDDIKALSHPVLEHRMALRPEAQMRGTSIPEVIASVLRNLPVPGSSRVAN